MGTPLRDGKYVVVPRPWLAQWRSFVAGGDLERPGTLAFQALLCGPHARTRPPQSLLQLLDGQLPDLKDGEAALPSPAACLTCRLPPAACLCCLRPCRDHLQGGRPAR